MCVRLTKDEIVRSGDAAPLELFMQGIKAKYTQEKYTRTLRQILCQYFEEILEGDFEERVAQLVKHGREDQEWTRDLLLNLSRKLRERTTLPKDDPDYLNPTTFGNYFKPIKKLFDMNDIVMPWKRLYATYPELDNIQESRGWSREEISMMLKHARDPMEQALVLVLSSSGARIGGIDLNWEDLVPIYRVNGNLVLDPGAEACEVACAMLQVYRGSAANYMAFITPEAYESLKVYGLTWADHMGRQPGPKDPIFLAIRGIPKRASMQSVKKRLDRIVTHAKLRPPNTGKSRRHNVPLTNGFRRFYNKTCKEALSSDSPLASLIKKEFMMGHKGMISLDQNYFKTSVLELAQEYLAVVPDLTVSDATRLKQSTRRMSENIRNLESEKEVHEAELRKQMARAKELLDVAASAAEAQPEKDAKMARLEKKVEDLENLRLKMFGMGNVLKRPKATKKDGAVASETDALKALLLQMEEIHRANIEEVTARQNKKISVLEDMVRRLSKRPDVKGDPLAEYEARNKEYDGDLSEGHDPRHGND